MADDSAHRGARGPLTPHGYLTRIAQWVRTHERVPMTWAHVVFISLDTAISHSSYQTEPLLRVVRDALRTRVLDKLRADEPGLDDADLRDAVGRLVAYERGRPRLSQLQDRFLRWLSDHPNFGDSTLGEWREILAETGIEAKHFDGRGQWPSGAPLVGSGEVSAKHWSDELAELVGLQRVRTHIRELQGFLEVERARRGTGRRENPVSLHQVFLENPGTGKTTVARILGKIYQEFGFLSKGHFVEVDRSGLVANYIGETERKTTRAITRAIGGVLFIDEAYSLAGGGPNDFGAIAIDTLVKQMEDHRHDLVVIVAGYRTEMASFIRSNPGLHSRFNEFVHFDDYSGDELVEIFHNTTVAQEFQVEEGVLQAVRTYLGNLRDGQAGDFGNAREVRTLWELTLRRQGRRLATEKGFGGGGTDERLMRIATEDVPRFSEGTRSLASPLTGAPERKGTHGDAGV